MIPKTFIDELLNRVDIVDVIEKFVPLKRSGANLSACCPFHEEKTPSFTVSQQKQFYHCFGCGAHGSAISFLMEYQGLGFIDAIENLAARVGVEVPRDQRNDSVEEQRDSKDYFLTNSRAASYYKRQLKDAADAIGYLKGRGIDGSVAAKFLVGYASDDWQGLNQEFNDYDGSQLLLDVGLINEKDGRRYDRFRRRIIFPIRDFRGRVIAFGGRVIDQGEPKYLNSPETSLFHKGKEVYGFWESRHTIRQKRQILVVEGYMDVVALHQSGITYAVATLGTAVTEFQVSRLLKQCSDLIFCFDGDSAGRKAAFRALESGLSQIEDGSKISFLFLPDGEDPDSFVRTQGREVFEESIEAATPMSDVLINELTRQAGNLESVEGRSKLASLFKPMAVKIKAPMMRKLLTERVSSLTGLSSDDLGDQEEPKTRRPLGVNYSGRAVSASSSRASTSPSVLQHLIEMLISFPDVMRDDDSKQLDDLRPNLQEHFATAQFDVLAEILGLAGMGLNQTEIIDRVRGSNFETSILRAMKLSNIRYQQDKVEIESVKSEYEQAWEQLHHLSRLNLQRELLSKKSLSSLSEEDKARYRSLMRPKTGPKAD
ncbi:MAG: DNA primase [Burkholderiales bacterium]|nr:DNA primase [Burkholderiales bacterium]